MQFIQIATDTSHVEFLEDNGKVMPTGGNGQITNDIGKDTAEVTARY